MTDTDHELEILAKGIKVGEDKAWKLAGDILSLSIDEREELFGYAYCKDILRMFSVYEAAKIMDEHREKQAKYNPIFEMVNTMNLCVEDLNEFLVQFKTKYNLKG